MINKPKHLTPKQLELVKETYRIVLTDNVITDKEMEYLHKLYWLVFDTKEKDDVVVKDLAELAGWTIKNVSK